jgi:Fur family peroxide stress response transcriptional regulator
MTRQRREVYEVLLAERDHPTAAEVFERSRVRVPGISLATVYNCLETLSEAGYVRLLTVDRGPARYCPNLAEHAHFLCDECGQVFDVEPFSPGAPVGAWRLPEGAAARQVETVLRGCCRACAEQHA